MCGRCRDLPWLFDAFLQNVSIHSGEDCPRYARKPPENISPPKINRMPGEDHYRITVRELREHLSKLSDDSRLAIIADTTRCQFLGIAPSEAAGVEDVFVLRLRLLPNYPPVSW